MGGVNRVEQVLPRASLAEGGGARVTARQNHLIGGHVRVDDDAVPGSSTRRRVFELRLETVVLEIEHDDLDVLPALRMVGEESGRMRSNRRPDRWAVTTRSQARTPAWITS